MPGLFELLIMFLIGSVYLAVPIATLVGVFLTYGKVKRIEQALNERG